MSITIRMDINGEKHQMEVDPRSTLLDVLRDQLNLKSVQRGCEEGECGACTVLADGEPVYSCLMLAAQADGKAITTVEGLLKDGEMHPLMRSFSENHGAQCGYCTSGVMLAAYSLIEKNADLTENQIRKGIVGNICRCTGYANIVKSIEQAMSAKRAGEWW